MKKTKVIIALEGLSEQECLDIRENLLTYCWSDIEYLWGFKVSPEQYFKIANLRLLRKIFVDRKFDDIPNRVKTDFDFYKGIQLLSFHLSANQEITKRILEWGIKNNVLTAGVLLLSSISQKDALHEFRLSRTEIVYGKAVQAAELNVPALVVSSQEVKYVKEVYAAQNKEILVITPGIRFKDSFIENDDQKITSTPFEAVCNGADFLVIGRPMARPNDPVQVFKRIVQEIREAEEDMEQFRKRQYYG